MKVASHDDLPSHEMYYRWNNSAWDSTGQRTYLYDSNGNLLSNQYDTYSNNQFSPSLKYTYSYDANGRQIEAITASWIGSTWVNSTRVTRTYDAQGNQTLFQYDFWTAGVWTINSASRSTYQYNGANQITEQFSEYYDTGTATWEMSEKQVFTYVSGVWTEVVYFRWDAGAWVLDGREIDLVWHDFEKELLISGRLQNYVNGVYEDAARINCTYSQFDSQDYIIEIYNFGWQNASREILKMDRLDHEIRYESYVWSGTWDFDEGSQYSHNYDAQDRTLEIVTETMTSPSTSENYAKRVFSNFFTNAESAIEANLKVAAFPNPVTDQLNFDLKLEKNGPVSIALFDVQGRKRLETSSNYNGNTISVPVDAALENGVYFYQLKMGDAFAKGKVIIQH